jgi:hypothetical protein
MAVPTAASTVSATTAGDPLAPNSTKSIFPSHMPGFQIDDLIPSEIKKLLGGHPPHRRVMAVVRNDH